MIYGKECAQVDDENGRVMVTATNDPVFLKQGADLICVTRAGARELANDILACLDALEAGCG